MVACLLHLERFLAGRPVEVRAEDGLVHDAAVAHGIVVLADGKIGRSGVRVVWLLMVMMVMMVVRVQLVMAGR